MTQYNPEMINAHIELLKEQLDYVYQSFENPASNLAHELIEFFEDTAEPVLLKIEQSVDEQLEQEELLA